MEILLPQAATDPREVSDRPRGPSGPILGLASPEVQQPKTQQPFQQVAGSVGGWPSRLVGGLAGLVAHLFAGLGWLVLFLGRQGLAAANWLFGWASLMAGLALCASFPIICLLSFGYFLEVSGRIARERRFTAGLIGIQTAGKLGGIALGIWLVTMPLRLTSSLVESAWLVGGLEAGGGIFAVHLLVMVLVTLHILRAFYRGARLWHFLWPFPSPLVLLQRIGRCIRLLPRQPAVCKALSSQANQATATWPPRGWFGSLLRLPLRLYSQAFEAFWWWFDELRPMYYLSLGLRGFLAAWVWLLLPVSLLAAGHDNPGLGIIGGLLLGILVLYLPFLEVRFAEENRLAAIFDVQTVRRQFRRAPCAFWLGFTVTLLAALPLYLAYVEYPPQQILWLPGLICVVFMWPARLLCGWAVARAELTPSVQHWSICWLARLAMVPVAAFYVLAVFFAQYVTQDGRMNLYDQHAFVMPFLNF